MKKHTFVMAVCLLYLVSGLAGTVSAEHTQIVETTNITYINGDWLINDSQNRTNETIVLTGNLVVGFGGNLTFRNVTLMMNCTSDGQYQIEVQNGGTMNTLDLDDDNTTTTDASNITANNSNYEYKFRVRTGANFTMRNSELHECGYGPFLAVDNYGLFIQTDNAIIEYNLISQNYIGVILYSSDAVVSNNTIGWNERTGIHSMIWSNGTIINNLIDSNKVYGINVDGGSNSDPKPANNLIINNKIVNTGQGTTTANAIHVQIYSCPIIKNNEIIDYTEDAVYFGEWCQVTIDNLTINADGGNYGLASSSCRYVTISNCSMNNTSLWDLSLATAYYKMINCTFNQSKVIFQGTDSNLTMNWFLNTYINDILGNPIPNANIRIQDNANGTFDENVTTDSNGFLNWTILTEYFQKDINGDKDGDDPGERIDYSPYNITVSKPGYQTAYAEVEMNESKYITITLEPILTPAQTNLTLFPGWNLISLPVLQPKLNGTAITCADDLATATDCTILSKWNASGQEYINYIVGFNLPTDPENFVINPDEAVFVWLNGTGHFTITGFEPGPRNVHLLPGWNTVGYMKMTIGNAGNDWAGQVSCDIYDDICYYENGTFKHYIFPGTEMALVPTRGYFVWSDNETWLVY
jgi:parallel beta-helix repeat protein